MSWKAVISYEPHKCPCNGGAYTKSDIEEGINRCENIALLGGECKASMCPHKPDDPTEIEQKAVKLDKIREILEPLRHDHNPIPAWWIQDVFLVLADLPTSKEMSEDERRRFRR